MKTLPQSKIFKAGIRFTDLPYRTWWGFWIRFFKTFEVLVFKLLQAFDLYRPQKCIIGIPSLAMRQFTNLAAIVFNGTQEEVLGFRSKRIIHRILKGLPDLELFERVRFQLSVAENSMRTIEGSTETRGFINLQLPWQIPWKSGRKAWLRMQPVGVETLFGKVSLGDYEVFSSPVFFLSDEIKWVIISDIDDTIKDSKIAETTGFGKIVSSLFKGHYYRYEPVDGMPELYQELAAKGALIIYLTSTPFQLTPFLLKFLKDCRFPEGPIFMRWLGYNRFGHKLRTLNRILSNLDRQKCIFVGDSGEQDLQIYRRICENKQYADRVECTLIRHVAGSPIQKTLNPREFYYRQIDELRQHFAPILD